MILEVFAEPSTELSEGKTPLLLLGIVVLGWKLKLILKYMFLGATANNPGSTSTLTLYLFTNMYRLSYTSRSVYVKGYILL